MSAARSSSGGRPTRSGRPGAAGRPAAARAPQLRPLEAREARGSVGGLALFALGFAVAGVLVAARQSGTPAYAIALSVGFLGIGVLGLFSRRVAAEVQPPSIWSPRGLARVADGAGLPARALTVAFYVLVAVGVAGNVLVPLTRH